MKNVTSIHKEVLTRLAEMTGVLKITLGIMNEEILQRNRMRVQFYRPLYMVYFLHAILPKTIVQC